jgi:hypothetical protein
VRRRRGRRKKRAVEGEGVGGVRVLEEERADEEQEVKEEQGERMEPREGR